MARGETYEEFVAKFDKELPQDNGRLLYGGGLLISEAAEESAAAQQGSGGL